MRCLTNVLTYYHSTLTIAHTLLEMAQLPKPDYSVLPSWYLSTSLMGSVGGVHYV